MLSTINKVNLKFEVNMNKKYILVLVVLTMVLSACTTTAGERGTAGNKVQLEKSLKKKLKLQLMQH